MNDLRRWMNVLCENAYPRVTAEQVGPLLYHGTSLVNAAKIITVDKVHGIDDEEGPEYTGVSLTTSFKRAAGYGVERTYHLIRDFRSETNFYGEPVSHLPKSGAVLEFDAPAIVRDFDVRAVVWQVSDAPEERVMGDIAPASRYLRRIFLDSANIPAWIAAFEANLKPSKPHGFAWINDTIPQVLTALRKLARYPKLAAL
jgi:hypothetical protein